MKTRILLAALLAAAPAVAHDYGVGALSIAHPYAIETPPNAPVAGGYLEITNAGDADDVLVSASVDEAIAGATQLHRMEMDGGVMRMSEVEGGIPVPAGETVVLQRGGLHVMFMQLVEGLEAGAEVPATLTFRDAGPVEVVFAVETRAEAEARAGGGHDH
ncbi:copper chaperone PCu(A)C [Jannaschia sp. Os4]|uniref:copper chaperone PCu(A)C n=1 Tax=Jannaschia sp. Os4 TaxID=2807617 RepID=UPI001939738C|nr:copper chaperone PCu(A)C [Jannaschia sp. Os4]MBM2574999.1 copper chaperone PCu(A)C [Jannaschia sp. Os4]